MQFVEQTHGFPPCPLYLKQYPETFLPEDMLDTHNRDQVKEKWTTN